MTESPIECVYILMKIPGTFFHLLIFVNDYLINTTPPPLCQENTNLHILLEAFYFNFATLVVDVFMRILLHYVILRTFLQFGQNTT